MNSTDKKSYDPDGKISRTAYIIQAMVEYFVAIATSGTFLTNLLNYLNFSTASQGIISSAVSLMFAAQLIAVLAIRKRTGVKRMVIFMNILAQFFFSVIYLTPLFDISSNAKSALLLVLFISANAFLYLSTPFKNAWMMSNVQNNLRGIFTAKKEIVSLIGGIIFTFIMGRIIDIFEANENIEGSFTVCCIVALGFAVINTLCLIFTKETVTTETEKLPGFRKNFVRSWNITMKNPGFRKVLLISSLYYCAHAATYYDGTFQRNYLGMSMTFISILSMVGAASRALVSVPFGNYADKHGWAKMLIPAFALSAVARIFNIFSNATIGVVTFSIFHCLNSMALGGANSGIFNISFEYVDREDRTDALAWQSTIGGIAGFLASLVMSAFVDMIEANGNMVFGISVFPQQILAALSASLYIALAIIMYFEAKKSRIKN